MSDFVTKDAKDGRVLTRRAFVIGGLQGALLCVLGGRLAWLQVSQGERYKTLSDKNRIDSNLLVPERGEIVDRFGVPLAVNQQNFRVLVVPEQTKDMRDSLGAVQDLLNLDEAHIAKVLEQAGRTAKFVPVEIADDLTWKDVAKIEVNLPDLPGISIDVGKSRTYPFSESTAHLVGYVGAVSQAELNRNNSELLRQPGFKTGKTGLERTYDKALRGAPGNEQVEVNVMGREVRRLEQSPARSGARLALSVDAELQRFTQERLGRERSASAVIMDAYSGEIYALSSSPAFDPNQFSSGLSAAVWEELLASEEHPLTNKAIAGQYPPGSTFKMVTALAALEAGLATPKTVSHCPGHYEYGTDLFHCWKSSGHGWVDVVAALSESCDTYFYELATELGIDAIAEMAHRLGLGQEYNFELGEERAGLVPTRKWKMGRFGQKWRAGESIIASIGQGYLQATPLQMAVMTARLVNGGRAVLPWLVLDGNVKSMRTVKWPSIQVKKKNLDLLKRGMDDAVNHEEGTAYEARIKEKGFEYGGKTGTSQVKRITMAQRRSGVLNKDLPWKLRHHALFVGYAPIHDPRYVCSVVVEHGGGGSSIAAPLARDLLMQTQRRAPAGRTAGIAGAKGRDNG